MSDDKDRNEIGDLGVTIRSETNATLEEIKARTGLSKSLLANIGLAHIAEAIKSGQARIVNGEVEWVKPPKAKAA